MGLFGKGVTWLALHSMGDFQGESQPLLSRNQEKSPKTGIIQYFNPTVIIEGIRKKWRTEENKDIKKST
nr:S2 protein [Equine infectious anemia virus]